MKKIFTRFTKLLLLILLPGFLFAQPLKDYNLQLHSRKFIPERNISSISKNSFELQKSLYDNKYYVVIQFEATPDKSVKDRLSSLGIELIDYIPNYAYTATVPASVDINALQSLNVRSIVHFTVNDKAPATLLNGEIPVHAIKQPGYADLTLVTYEKINAGKIASSIISLGATILADNQVFRSFVVRLPVGNVKALTDLAFVQWVEPIAPANVIENLPGRTLHRVNILNDGVRNLKGDGINIGIWDGGAVSTQHLDLSPAGRVTVFQTALGTTDHGTHVAGTITGKGLVNPIARGMAPNANLFSWDFNGDIQAEMAAGIPANNLLVSNHSYGFSFSGACNLNNSLLVYESISRSTDINLNNFPSHLHVHSAGNSGGSCSGGFYTITGSGKQAKNNLVVADISTTEAVAGSSSRGPLQDGRIKPEISAMGTSVFSTWIPNNAYTTISGTSMATPGVTGAAALLFQRYKQLNGNANPPSSLIKNIICNGAADLGNPGPDYTFGFGRINALTAVKILESNRYAINTVADGAFNDVNVSVPAGAVRLKAMLTWNDPAGALNANPALVNDLDLTVTNGATTTLPWIMDKNIPSANATRGVDNYSNIEQVTIDNPPAGTYTLKVNGTNVAIGPNQQYSLTWIVDQQYIEVLYPNGGENLSPSSTQVITWDNAGITGLQTVEYSLNNGTNWTTISGSVPANTTRLNWSVPVANTSTALIRISSGAVTDNSDATFSIMGTPTGFALAAASCTAGEIKYTWPAVANATHYDIYRLDQTTGSYVILASDITTTTYTATGLTPGSTIWAALVAKNNTTGSVSDRSIAISGTAALANGGLSAIGSINGQTNICGPVANIVYTIPTVTAATSYTWTVPANVTIVSGQGTSSLTVTYTASSISGNITVFASAGTCQTSIATLPITFNAAVAAPVSGGDQSITVCPSNPIPTLTATATVPGGHTLTWYDALTAGNIVASPTLNTVGTKTYFASSTNTTTGCVSPTRTAVVLTIAASNPASITAGGPTTFCQGGSVILTANAGTSYLWSNGATTQSITVSSSGSYSVAVTTGGCTNTSSATNVTVNPLPVSTITAGGPTTFCQGLNVVLTASAGSSWLWSNGATSQSITVSASGNFSVTVTNGSGCSALSSITSVTVNSNPTAVITAGGALTFCQGGNVVLTANAGTSYLWSNGATTQNTTISTSGSYTVTVTQAGGCTQSSAATVVTVNPIPAANITAGGPTTFCDGNNVVLTASAGSSWLWSNGATTQGITVTTGGAYSVKVTNASGCFANSTATNVTVNTKPSVTLSAAPYTKLFPGLTTTLSVGVNPAGTYSYSWLRNGTAVTGATTASLPVTLDKIGDYSVIVTNNSVPPCSTTSAVVVIGDSSTNKLFVYPNPNSGEFQVNYFTTAVGSHTLSVYDSKGSLVFSKAFSLNTPYQRMDVDIRKHGRGIYNVALFDKNGNRLASKQVIIQ